ncbi:hypothetical protein JTB14_004391 [Gonioctena quinquepunctata]|nr:hypothetical protein JTB14_004391 [Gonioctena quinquepunctata]
MGQQALSSGHCQQFGDQTRPDLITAALIRVEKMDTENYGRKQENFIESSDIGWNVEKQELRKNLETKELTYAARMKLRADGNVAAAKISDDITNIGPKCATYHMKVGEVRNNRLTEDKALSLLTEAKLTKFQYNIIRSNALEKSCNLNPNYECVIKAKKICYPDNILITESSAEIQLQSLLDHTIEMLGLALRDAFSGLTESLSSLHCWIRFYEWMLNLAYKLKLCEWQARGSEDKIKYNQKKKEYEMNSKLNWAY